MKVLQIEFNELSPRLLEEFMAAGKLPSFQRFHSDSEVFTTDAEAAPPNLEPWIQWPSVHLGVSHEEHGLRHLGVTESDEDLATGRGPRVGIAQVLSDAGIRVGVFGAMNVPYGRLDGFYVPDPWNDRAVVHPASLAPYLHTVRTMIRDSSRTDGESPGAGLPAFGAFLLRNGLTPGTVAVLVKQLLAERRDPGLRWRRASCLDWLQYDVFRTLVRRTGVDFATFFSNSTAHYQHYFWRHMDPSRFTTPPDPADHASYADAVLFGYQSMDRILGRVLADYPDATLVLCTALSQQPWTDATKQTYRPRDWNAVLALAGYSTREVEVQPIMAEQFVARFPSPAAAEQAVLAFGRLTVDGRPLMTFDVEGAALIGGCAIDSAGAGELRISGTADGSTPLLGDVFRPIHTVRSGRHSAEGALWFRTGRHEVHEQPVRLQDIAPTCLSLLGVDTPAHMSGRVLPVSGARTGSTG